MSQSSLRIAIIFSLLAFATGRCFAQNKSYQQQFTQAINLQKQNPEESFSQFLALSKGIPATDSLYVKALIQLARIAQDLQSTERDSIVYRLLRDGLQQPFVCTEPDRATLFFLVATYEEAVGHDFEMAVSYFEKSLTILTRLYGQTHPEVAKCYIAMGDIYKYSTYDFFLAEHTYELALKILEQMAEKDIMQLARTYYSLATTNRSQRDHVKALSYALKTLGLMDEIDNAIFRERTYLTLANIYRDMQNYAEAKKFYEKALSLNLHINKGNEFNETRAIMTYNQGECYARAGDLVAAIKEYEKAINYYSKITISIHINYVTLLQQTGLAYSRVNNPKARAFLSQALHEASRMGIRKGSVVGGILMTIGSHYFRRSRYDSALQYYERAIAEFSSGREKRNSYQLYEAFFGKASTLKKMAVGEGSPQRATVIVECYSQAEKILNANRDALDIEQSKLDFFETKVGSHDENQFNVYEEIISWLFESRNLLKDSIDDQVLYFLEQSRMKSTHKAMREAEQFSGVVEGDSLLRKLRDCRSSFFDIQDQLNREESRDIPDENRISYLQGKITEVDRAVQSLKAEINQRYPAFYSSNFSAKTPTLHELQNFSALNESAVIEYFWGASYVYALGLNNHNVLFLKLGRTDSIQAWVKSFTKHFTGNGIVDETLAFERYQQYGYGLYDKLVKPFTKLLTGKRMYIIPDGLISQVPFEALLTTKTRHSTVDYKNLPYLLNKQVVSYSFSSTILIKPFVKISNRPEVLAVGYTNRELYRSSVPTNSSVAIEPELDVLATYFSKGRYLIGSDASEANFKQFSPQAELLHLAVHGAGDPERDYSAELYFKAEADSAENGRLHSYELYRLRLKASLAMLTACESGIGKNYRGEGMMSMANSFVHAGCANVGLTLWKLNDKVSTKLVRTFYNDLSEGGRIDEALAHAKRNYLEGADEYTANPKLWAALVMYSNGDELVETSASWKMYLCMALGAVGLALTVWFLKRYY
ncbi:MAG: CHAT domain-containing tetratricopeptide repeat protein [Cyclobacteriaceae bacterium]